MGTKQFLGGVTNTTLHFETDGTLHVEEKQDVEPILDYTHAARNHRFSGSTPSGDMRHVAEVPMVVMIGWAREAGISPLSREMSAVLEKKLQDPQYAKFLAAPKQRDPGIIIKGLR